MFSVDIVFPLGNDKEPIIIVPASSYVVVLRLTKICIFSVPSVLSFTLFSSSLRSPDKPRILSRSSCVTILLFGSFHRMVTPPPPPPHPISGRKSFSRISIFEKIIVTELSIKRICQTSRVKQTNTNTRQINLH